jgi:hypothetical protein
VLREAAFAHNFATVALFEAVANGEANSAVGRPTAYMAVVARRRRFKRCLLARLERLHREQLLVRNLCSTSARRSAVVRIQIHVARSRAKAHSHTQIGGHWCRPQPPPPRTGHCPGGNLGSADKPSGPWTGQSDLELSGRRSGGRAVSRGRAGRESNPNPLALLVH